jgi:hypothetical protein
MGASPQTPEIFLGIAPVFNELILDRRSITILLLFETQRSAAETQLRQG